MSFAWYAHAQKISPQLLSSSGGYNKSGGMSLHWAVGEVAVSNHFNNPIKLKEGFFQGNVYLTASKDIQFVNIKIYPNPASTFLNITDPENLIKNIFLIDVQGRTLSIDQKIPNELNLSDIPSGLYILKVLLKSNRPIEYRIVKI